MGTVLAAWELGGNLGHLATLSGISTELAQRGHRVYLASQRLQNAHTFVDRKQVRLLQTPLAGGRRPKGQIATYTFADLIKYYGFLAPEELLNTVIAWRELFGAVKPDLVILNSAAVGFVACKGQSFKTITLGSGYSVPPFSDPLPSLITGSNVPEPLRRERERPVLAAANYALEALGQPALEHLWQLFDVDDHFFTTFKELDHYPDRTFGHHLGPLGQPASAGEPVWPDAEGPKVFVYVRRESRHFTAILQALRESDLNVLAYVPDLSPPEIAELQTPSLRLSLHPFDMTQLVQRADLAVCHAGMTTIAEFMRGGVPLLLLPNHLEQSIAGQLAVRQGAARMLKTDTPAPAYREALRELIHGDAARRAAAKFRSLYPEYSSTAALHAFADRLEGLIPPLSS